MIIGDMEIRLRADLARLQRDMDDARRVVGNATAGMERAAQAAKAAFAGIAAGLGGAELIRMSDEYAKFTAQLKLATQSQREYAAAYADVKRISTQSTQGLGETGVLYARIANGTRELGVAQKQVAAITETVNLSLLVSGATASEAASAQLQLSQAFASGTLRGEEFNAVNEAAPRLMLALADGIGVPVGALKKMAEEGEITSKIMADVLPKALGELQVQAKEVQTIAGAFTVLKNNMMEFTGAQAQSSGAVSALTSGISLLANNLNFVAGAIATVTASKISSWAAAFISDTYRQTVATKELQTATLARAVTTTEAAALAANAKMAEAQADVRATASALGLANARVAELRSAVLSADGAVALAIATNGLIPAQARAAAMAEAHSIALSTQAVAAAGATTATVASTVAIEAQATAATLGARAMVGLRAAVGFLGGPVGAIVTLLGVGAMAWSHWGNAAKEANDKTAQSVEETHDEVLARLQKQIDKLNQRAALAKAQPNLKIENAADLDRMAGLWAEYNDAKNGTGKFANATAEYRGVMERIALREHGELLKKLTAVQAAQTGEAQRGVDTRVAAFMKENATKQEQMNAEIKAIEDLKGKTAQYDEMVRRIREKYADKGAAAAIKQEATAYQSLMTSIHEKIAANQLELSGYDKLSESQKATIKLDAEIDTGKNKLSASSIKQARAEIERLAVQEEQLELQKQHAKWAEAEAKSDADHYDKLRAGTAAIEERIVQMRGEIDLYGLSASAAIDAEKAKLEAKLALGPATHAELIALDQQIEKLGQLAELTRKKEVLDASKKAADQVIEDQKRLWGDIERTAHDTFISIFDSGKSAFDRLKDALKNGLYDLLYQMTVKKWIVNISGQVSGAGGLSTSTAGGDMLSNLFGGSGGGGGAMSLLQNGMKLYDAFKGGFAGIGSNIGQGVSYLGNAMGNNSIFSFGQGMQGFNAGGIGSGISGQAAGYGQMASGALGVLGGVAGGVFGGRAISGGYSAFGGSGNSAVNTGTAVGAAIGSIVPVIGTALGALVGGLVGGAANRLFGHKAPTVEAQGIQGTISSSGFNGQTYAEILEKGGWFRSDKRYTQTAALGTEQDSALDTSVKAMMDSAKGFAATLGIEAGVIDGYNKQIKLQLGTDEAKNQEAIAKLFGEIGDELSLRLVPNLAGFALAGETTSATLQRLVTDYATVDAALTAIGMQFGAVGVQSLEARERLLAAAGGLEAFAANTAGFQQNFLTEAERNAPVLKAVTEQLAALGLAGVDTRDEFKQVVLGLDLTTDAGAKQYGALMKLQEAFAQVYPVIDHAAIAAAELAKAEERANQVREERRGLQDQLDELTMSELQLLEKRRAALDESNRPLFDQIEAAKAAKAALEAQAEAQRAATQAAEEARVAAVQAAKDRGSALLAGVDSMFSALQSVVTREKALLQDSATAHRALSSALRGTLDGMRAVGDDQADRMGAQAQIRAALAIARAGGALPDADSLKGALSAVSKDASSMFATQQDYLRDFYATQNDIADLAGLTDKSLSAEEQQLQKLDGILSNAQQQIDALKGIDMSVLSLAEVMRGFAGAIGAAQANPVASSGGSLAKLYREVLGRPADSAGMSYWQDQVAAGMSLDQVRQFMQQSDEYKRYTKVPGFAGGGDHTGGIRLVGELGPEVEVTGPSRIHNTRDLMASLRTPSDNSAVLAAAVERLTATTERQARTIERLEEAMDQTQSDTKRMADGLEMLSNGWNELRTKEQIG